MADQLEASSTDCSGIQSVTVSDNHSAATATATVICSDTGLDVGSSIDISLGYSGNTSKVFSGYVKHVQRSESPDKYELSCSNEMIRAVDYFIASSNPEEPYTASNISIENLIGDLMAMAGLTNYAGGHPGYTFATEGTPLEVNLTSVYDFSKMLADLIAWHIYADNNGRIHFLNRKPYPGGESSVASIDRSNCANASFFRSDRDLRNRVVVYGSYGVYGEASAESPYLPGGFFKTVVFASPALVTNNALADAIATYNLEKLNRLTIGGTATIVGDSHISCRDCVTANMSSIGMNGLLYVYGISHNWSKDGYTTDLDLRQ